MSDKGLLLNSIKCLTQSPRTECPVELKLEVWCAKQNVRQTFSALLDILNPCRTFCYLMSSQTFPPHCMTTARQYCRGPPAEGLRNTVA